MPQESDRKPVICTRYPAEIIRWACEVTGFSRAKVLSNALDMYIAKLRGDA